MITTRTKHVFTGLLIIILTIFVSPHLVFSAQSIEGTINTDLILQYKHILEMSSKKYKKLLVSTPVIGITQIKPVFTGSPTHTTIEKKDVVTVTLKKEKGEKIELSYDLEPAFNTPVFVGYDLTLFVGSWLEEINRISIAYPDTLNLISSKPVNTQAGSVEINYPKNDNYGLIHINFLKKTLPPGYVKEDMGIYTVIGTRADVTLLKSALKDLGFVPSMFERITGRPLTVDRIYIVVDNLSGKGDIYQNAGGLSRSPNMVLLDKSVLEDVYLPSLQKLIVHEVTHTVLETLFFSNEETNTGWMDEGIAVFFQNYAGDTYLNEKDYFVEEYDNGDIEVLQDLWHRFTPQSLKDEYKKKFSFDVPSDEDKLDAFYSHSGLIFYNFYKQVGDPGMQKFFDALSTMKSSGTCKACDTNKVLDIMMKISGMKKDEILYPYKNNMGNVIELVPIIKNDYTESQIDEILSQY